MQSAKPYLRSMNIAPIAVITGATKGLGRAMSEVFAANGYDLIVCARTESALEDMHEEWQKRFPERRLLNYPADLSKKSEVMEFGAFVKQNTTHIEVLINNAGLFMPGHITTELEGTLETQIETNLYSAYHLTRAVLPLMLKLGRGHIFNICSVASIKAYPNGGSYSISKFALLGLTKVLREELKNDGIKVTAVLPGAAWSDSWRGVDVPHDRLMEANDVALSVFHATQLSPAAVVEEILLRPQLGDL